ncbi:WD40-repeat-containing domain protein [Pseudomassariella vexata]|uniref:WD40-repeat-containing domain protein n=1 Tax=Pseudomassariella vexata TaxID=1141098 RepID=A0A1Y2DQM1_9PEZI|nr:WD40-repeat-containing domain protein [Pseudomassariella vexata]ORY61592.1 WD40-repeat-containing domain protein [Pseudomassariella vexata]
MEQSPLTTQASRRPRSSQTTVSLNWDEADALSPHPRLKFEVAECIETKTITTTTTTKRSYPPLFVREPRPLMSLDSKEYPLAQKRTPPELSRFSFDVDQYGSFSDDETDCPDVCSSIRPPVSSFGLPTDHATFQSFQTASSEDSSRDIKTEPGIDTLPVIPRRHPDTITRRTHKMGTRAGSPMVAGAVKKNSSSANKLRSHGPSLPHQVSDKLRRAIGKGPASRKENVREGSTRTSSEFPITPDTSELAGSSSTAQPQPLKLKRTNLDSFETPDSDPTQQHDNYFNISSPSGSDSHTVFSNVATPPITDADAEPFTDADESLQQSIRGALHHPRPINTVAQQDASLPSPRLSPTLQAVQLPTDREDGEDDDMSVILHDGSQNTMDDESLESTTLTQGSLRHKKRLEGPSVMDSRSMLESFDAMPAEMKSFMMYQFLRRCSRKTLHVVANVVNPALNCDILKDLPTELTLHVLSYLDHRDLCRAAQVSKTWRNIIDYNETGWKELFDRDGFELPPGELDRAIKEGWGWQDPVGPEGCERDFSLQNRLTSTEADLLRSSSAKPDPPASKLRSSKRKRALNNFSSDRNKRRASAQDSVIKDKEEKTQSPARLHKSEGPISAASAAALAVPDPHIGLPSLRKLHLFKSLYRRHYMIRKSWTSGKVKPSHVAFAAHPRHVITCLQFDEDKIITGSDDMLIHVYDTKTGKLRKRLEGHEGGVWALQYEGNYLVSGSTDRSVRVWDIEKGLCTQVFYGHTSTVRCLQILMPTETGKIEDGQAIMMPPKPLIITGSRDSQLRVWRLPEAGSRRYIQTGPPANDADCPYFIRTLQGHNHSVRAIAAHTDTLVSGSYDNTVRVWKISTGETVHVLQGHTQKVYSVVLDVSRNRCISGSMDTFVKIWDLTTGSCIHTLEGHSLLVGLLDLRDERLVSAAADSTLRIWDPESGRCQSTLTAHTGAITCFQHDGRKVISGSDRTLKMWDIRTGECIQDLLTDLSGVWQVRFDERRCVAAVQRDNLTYVEILDFGAVRDGKHPEELGKRILLNAPEVRALEAAAAAEDN